MELWLFAARYSLTELEEYCRTDPKVFKKLVRTVTNPTKGIESLRNQDQIPLSTLNDLVCDIVSRLTSQRDGKIAKLNQLHHVGVTCEGCQVKNIKGLRYRCKVCRRYDLCENCYGDIRKLMHNEEHNFKQIPQKLAPLLS